MIDCFVVAMFEASLIDRMFPKKKKCVGSYYCTFSIGNNQNGLSFICRVFFKMNSFIIDLGGGGRELFQKT